MTKKTVRKINVEALAKKAALSARIAHIRHLAFKTLDARESAMLRRIADAYAQEDLPLKAKALENQLDLFGGTK